MAINGSQDITHPTRLLNPKGASLAGALSIVMALLGIAAVVYYLTIIEGPSASLKAMAGVKVALLAVVAIAGVQLIRGRIWAQRLLLIVWLAGLVFVAAMAAAGMLWGVPKWWSFQWSPAHVLIPTATVEILAVAALVWASASASRLRYATNVAITIAAAMALMAVVNMFSQTTYVRRNVESLQRFSLSHRTMRILDSLDEPVRVTCVYTAADKGAETDDQRARVVELLREMHEHNGLLEATSITTDAQKAALVARLRQAQAAQAQDHSKVLAEFRDAAPEIVRALSAQQQIWQAAAGKSYLDQWGLTAQIARLLQSGTEQIEKSAANVSSQLEGTGLPEYRQLVDQVRQQMTRASQTVKAINTELAKVTKLPATVKANRDVAMGSADDSLAAVAEMARALGEPGSPLPEDPAAVLDAFVSAADKASQKTQTAARTIDRIAGKESIGAVRASQAWLSKTGGTRAMLPDGSVVMLGRRTITDLYNAAAAAVTRLKIDAKAIRQAANTEHQAKSVGDFRKAVASLAESLRVARKAAAEAIDTLATVDKLTETLLKQVESGLAFADVMAPVAKLLAAIEELPELEEDTLSEDITRDNIVIVEAGGKTEVVDFETVWPLQDRSADMADAEGPAKRSFNGDAAISSRILAITNDPFATVLITYYRPEVSQEAQRTMPRARLSPDSLSALTERLKAANFQVEQWNLKDDRPVTEDERPQVLLVLPPELVPPMQMRGGPKLEDFGPEHLDKLRKAIDQGAPAIFLASFQPPRQMSIFSPMVSPPYLLGEYLEKDWGIEVLIDHLVVAAVPDQLQPGKMRIDIGRLNYFPLSTFTDHIIGLHLQGQRMLWPELAPVRTASQLPEGLSVQPLLTVPANQTNTWGTRRIDELVKQFRTAEESFISPDYQAGDLHVPFDLAVTAVRAAGEDRQASRIVVMGLGAGLRDGYLNERVGVINPDRTLSLKDPPLANADVVINSVCWLMGLERYIARGPAQIKPVAMIPPATLNVLRLSCLILLPALVLAIGATVLLIRRR